jgi:hypothetical protein
MDKKMLHLMSLIAKILIKQQMALTALSSSDKNTLKGMKGGNPDGFRTSCKAEWLPRLARPGLYLRLPRAPRPASALEISHEYKEEL